MNAAPIPSERGFERVRQHTENGGFCKPPVNARVGVAVPDRDSLTRNCFSLYTVSPVLRYARSCLISGHRWGEAFLAFRDEALDPLGMQRSWPSSMKRIGSRAAIVVPVLVAADLICTLLFLNRVNQYAEGLEQAKSDVGIVLFSDFEAGGLGPETLRRVAFASRMLKKGAFDHILCTGGARPGRNLYGSELMKEWFLASGIPPEKLFLERTSNDTRSNLKEAFALVREKGWQKTRVISSPLHMFRVKDIRQNMEEPLSVLLAAYSYEDCRPKIDKTTLWWQAHYEWAACLLQRILPARYYQKLIDLLRA
jgi:uncharacterized SAM-binding protein YcdF (DUF218 family)